MKIDRTQLIAEIIAAARRPMPQIAESYRYRHKRTGNEYSIFGLPFLANRDDYEPVLKGYVWRANDGTTTTHGNIAASPEELKSRWEEQQRHTDDEFRDALIKMTDSAFEKQVGYWLHRPQWTTELHGRQVLARKTPKYGISARHFANRSQAEEWVKRLGSGWAVFHWHRPFFVAKLRPDEIPTL